MAKRYISEGDVIIDDDSKVPYFLLGLGLGVAAGILFAPKAGAETRQILKSRAQDGADYVKRRTENLQDSAAEVIDRGKQTLQRGKENLGAAVEAGRQAYREAAAPDKH